MKLSNNSYICFKSYCKCVWSTVFVNAVHSKTSELIKSSLSVFDWKVESQRMMSTAYCGLKVISMREILTMDCQAASVNVPLLCVIELKGMALPKQMYIRVLKYWTFCRNWTAWVMACLNFISHLRAFLGTTMAKTKAGNRSKCVSDINNWITAINVKYASAAKIVVTCMNWLSINYTVVLKILYHCQGFCCWTLETCPSVPF